MIESLKNLLVERVGQEKADRLQAACVGVAGLGGLGSLAAITLARSGVGRLILADCDRVEAVNLHRQHYRIEDVGRLKTEAMAAILAQINPDLTIDAHAVTLTPENLAPLFKPCQVVLECFDQAEAKAMILSALSEKLPGACLIGASGLAGYGRNSEIKTFRLAEKIFIVGDLHSAVGQEMPIYAPRVGIAACMQANLALSLILGNEQDEESL